jgi:hypothetical protein
MRGGSFTASSLTKALNGASDEILEFTIFAFFVIPNNGRSTA